MLLADLGIDSPLFCFFSGGSLESFEGRTEGASDEDEELESVSESDSDEDDEVDELSSDEDEDEEDEEIDVARTGAALGSTGFEVLGAAASFALFRGGGPGDGDLRLIVEDVTASATCCTLIRNPISSVRIVEQKKNKLGHTIQGLHPEEHRHHLSPAARNHP